MSKKLNFIAFTFLCISLVALVIFEICAITQMSIQGSVVMSYKSIKVGDIVYYGEWPRSYVGSSLNSTLLSLKNSGNLTATGKTYRSYNYKTLCHFEEYIYNGEKYVFVPQAKFWDGSDDGGGYGDNSKFSTGDPAGAKTNQGQACFFKVEPIPFEVMETDFANGQITVYSVDIIGSLSFNESGTSNAWANSDIRGQLNNNLLPCSGLDAIAKQVTIKNNVTGNYTDGTGTSTLDYIWLPSIDDIDNWHTSRSLEVGSTSSILRKNVTDFATATYTRNLSGYTYYGLRSSGVSSIEVCWISNAASARINDNFKITGSDLGICPALVVNLV